MSSLISPVENNYDKNKTYRSNINRFNRAMKEGFYFEAILIDYAMMEDRLKSFLYHIGLFKTQKSHKADVDIVKDSIRPILRKYKEKDENDHFSVMSISGKLKIARCILQWSEEELSEDQDPYLFALRSQIDKNLDVDSFLQTLKDVRKWCDYRNEIIHALMNKNLSSVHKDIEVQAYEGMRLCRELDNQVDKIKKGNWIRRSIKLQNK